MYCMPQVGTHASLYFPDGSASNAIVVGAIRKNGGTHASKRYFGTEHGSELEMTPTSIQLAGSPESLKVSFDDDAGVHFSSHKKLTLGATGDISLYTPKKIMLSAQSQIFVRKTQVSNGFTIESEYHVLGEKVRADGTDRTTFPDYQDNPVEDTASEKEGFSWGKLFGVVVAAVALTVSTFGAGAVVGAALVGAAIGAVGAIGGKLASDLANGEMSSPWEYVRSATIGALTGAVCGAIFGPFGGASSLLPQTTGQIGKTIRFLFDDQRNVWCSRICNDRGVRGTRCNLGRLKELVLNWRSIWCIRSCCGKRISKMHAMG